MLAKAKLLQLKVWRVGLGTRPYYMVLLLTMPFTHLHLVFTALQCVQGSQAQLPMLWG